MSARIQRPLLPGASWEEAVGSQQNQQRQQRIEVGELVQHIDGRQGRVQATGLIERGLPAALVKWFKGEAEVVVLGYIWATKTEENW